MEFDLLWLLLGLPLFFVFGWLASRFDWHQLRTESRRTPKAYFRGLNHLLHERQDEAIDAFIEAMQSDPDTAELHFALGNLFRRRGEYNRAVRVHKHLLERGDLSHADRNRAQHALAQDYLKAGLLDHAQEALRKLEGTPFEDQAHMALLSIYERSRDWQRASEIIARMQAGGQGDFQARQAHYLCEQAQAMPVDTEAARSLLTQAIAAAPQAARARIELARLHHRSGQANAALDSLLELSIVAPAAVPLAAPLLVETAQLAGQSTRVLALLKQHYENRPSLDVLDAIVVLEVKESNAAAAQRTHDWYLRHLEKTPSLVAATKWLACEAQVQPKAASTLHPCIVRTLEHAARPLSRYRCAACGFEAHQHFWQCPGCQTWDSYSTHRVEEL